MKSARSDYGIYLPVPSAIQRDPALELRLIVAAMHMSTEFGMTADSIRADGFDIHERVEMLLSSDSKSHQHLDGNRCHQFRRRL
jgi:hypothetical protein